MYVREAHPDPMYAPCGSTADLGWNHPSRDTVTVEERAQRARWLKDDFDLSFPYLIDSMTDAIKFTYRPWGFYVGWFIDCDRQVHVFERWAWATPDTQWCGLPLADADELETFLDAYLANPPKCYRGVSEEAIFVVPAVARIDGVGDTSWFSDVTIANPETQSVEVELTYLPRDRDNTQAPTREFVIGPGQSLTLTDVVQGTFETTGSGALVVRSQRPVVVVSRTYNDTPDGTFGQFIAGLDHRAAIQERTTVGHLLMLDESALFRSNLGLVNLGDAAVEVKLRFFTSDGSALGELSPQLPPFGYIQINEVLAEIDSAEIANVRAEIEVLTDGGRVLAYASTVDNRTGDPVFQTAWTRD